MNIEGLSEATLEKFILHGYVKDFTDLFHLDRYEEEIKSMDGFGEKSYQKLLRNIENARKTTLARLIYSLGTRISEVPMRRSSVKHSEMIQSVRKRQPKKNW